MKQVSSHRGIRLALLLVLMVGPSVPAASAEPPEFWIEKITFKTARLSADILRSESLLSEGRSYSEEELRQAVHRINRLPFVLSAEFSLAKGSERGRYELVIDVAEARRWFFQTDLGWALNDSIDRFDPRVEGVFRDRIGDTTDDSRALVGRRFAAGRRGLLFLSIGTEDGAFAIGYQRYNLWNRNVLLSVSLAGDDEVGDFVTGTASRVGRVQLGVPVRGDHAIRFLASYRERDSRFLTSIDPITVARETATETEVEVAWVYNSLDDPVLPRNGLLWELGATWSDLDETQTRFDRDGNLTPLDLSGERLGAIGAVSLHRPFGFRNSVSTGVRAFFGEGAVDGNPWEAEAGVGHQVFLIRRLEVDNWRELRFDTDLSVFRQDFSRGIEQFGLPEIVDGWRLQTGLTLRNGWGLFRFFVNYVEADFE